ncbi:hypothetical protein NCS52_01106800 [Fusarium sp. LHS14.1]|nr:hypothetical protein NCS52_01106800 [Fusarium sp. LHS14.1]
MPIYEDLHDIPYVRCLMKETWRWRPPVPLGHPHVTSEDINYEGYRISKGSELHLNAFAIGHDERRHHDPEMFIPERYEEDTATSIQSMNLADVSKRDHFAFGSGRRACPGYHVAERSLAVAIMRILWAFEIFPAEDAELPLDPSKFEGRVMPGSPDERLPVRLRVLDGRREVIDEYFKGLQASRPEFEPLVHVSTGKGAFKPLSFKESH